MDITLPQDEKKVLLFYNTHTNHMEILVLKLQVSWGCNKGPEKLADDYHK
jgi:hypothetical protein